MIRWTVAGLLLGALCGPARADALQDAEKAWQNREQPGQTQAAITAWEGALKENPDKPEIYISLTRACGRAYRQASSKDKKKKWAEKARTYGAQAVEKDPSSPEAWARQGEALGQWAQAHKGFGGLKVVKQAVASLEKSIELDPHYAFAHMLISRFYEDAPGMFSVGDKSKALKHAELAVQYGPDRAINHNTLAKIYLARDRKADAKKELEKSLTLKPPPDAVPETLSDQEDARELLKKL